LPKELEQALTSLAQSPAPAGSGTTTTPTPLSPLVPLEAWATGTPTDSGTEHWLDSFSQSAVRRLTPVECERLMGWPDGHTIASKWTVRSKPPPSADSALRGQTADLREHAAAPDVRAQLQLLSNLVSS
jgi:site-specific DNA-cytosine methylase